MRADEVVKRLRADPKWAREEEVRRTTSLLKAQRLTRNEAPIVEDLRHAGLKVESVYDLVNRSEPYPDAIPILLDHLERTNHYEIPIREGIARALTVKEARISVPAMLAAFRRDPDTTTLNGAKGALANAIDLLAGNEHFEEVLSLALDAHHGPGRAFLIDWLTRQPPGKVREAMQRLSGDKHPEVALKAQEFLAGQPK